MINKTFLWTSLFSALFTTISLKFLQIFHFINWSPVGWAKKWPQVDSLPLYYQMGFAFYRAVQLFLQFFILLFLSQRQFHHLLSAILIGIIWYYYCRMDYQRTEIATCCF